MTNESHDYAGCKDASCQRCFDYGDGYATGKEKAYSEVRAVVGNVHSQPCGCSPCAAVRSILKKY